MTTSLSRPTATSFALQEPRYSGVMFLDSLLPLLNNALPIIGSLFGGGAGGATAAAPAGGLNAQTLKDLVAAVQQIIGLFGTPQAATPAAAKPQSLTAPWGANTRYSQAAIAPALLAALPALAPLIEKALNPETLKAIGQITPTGQANAANEQIRQHLEKIMPSSDTSQIYQLLALLSTQESTGPLRS